METRITRAILFILISLAGFLCEGCSGGGGQTSTNQTVTNLEDNTDTHPPETNPAPVIHTFNWIDGAWTQEVPSWGSSVRLALPVPVGDISIDGTAIGAFGIHAGGHVEGMDHVWLHTRSDVTLGSWADGTVTDIIDMGPAGGGYREYFIKIDYGDGLAGKHMEVQTPLVSVGQVLKKGDPVGIGLQWGAYRSAEFMLTDSKRLNETGYGVKGAVSPFDYLNDTDKQALIARYVNEVVEPYFLKGNGHGDSNPSEPYLTNRIIIHPLHRGTLVGEWVLSNKGWKTPDPEYNDILSIVDNTNAYGSFKIFGMLTQGFYGGGGGNEGTWTTVDGPGKVKFNGNRILYGLYQIDESSGRAHLTIEWKEGGYPSVISCNAAIYVEREPIPLICDVELLGRLP